MYQGLAALVTSRYCGAVSPSYKKVPEACSLWYKNFVPRAGRPRYIRLADYRLNIYPCLCLWDAYVVCAGNCWSKQALTFTIGVEPEDMVVSRLYCHFLGMGFQFHSLSQSNSKELDNLPNIWLNVNFKLAGQSGSQAHLLNCLIAARQSITSSAPNTSIEYTLFSMFWLWDVLCNFIVKPKSEVQSPKSQCQDQKDLGWH